MQHASGTWSYDSKQKDRLTWAETAKHFQSTVFLKSKSTTDIWKAFIYFCFQLRTCRKQY